MWSSSYKAATRLHFIVLCKEIQVVTLWTGSESKNRNDQTKMDCKRQVKVLATVGIICAHLSMHIYTILIHWILQGIIYTCECRSAPHSKYKHGSYILRIYRSKEPTVGQAQWSSFVRQTYTRTVDIRLLTFTNLSFFFFFFIRVMSVNASFKCRSGLQCSWKKDIGALLDHGSAVPIQKERKEDVIFRSIRISNTASNYIGVYLLQFLAALLFLAALFFVVFFDIFDEWVCVVSMHF